jgi:hypothetical protein
MRGRGRGALPVRHHLCRVPRRHDRGPRGALQDYVSRPLRPHDRALLSRRLGHRAGVRRGRVAAPDRRVGRHNHRRWAPAGRACRGVRTAPRRRAVARRRSLRRRSGPDALQIVGSLCLLVRVGKSPQRGGHLRISLSFGSFPILYRPLAKLHSGSRACAVWDDHLVSSGGMPARPAQAHLISIESGAPCVLKRP